MLRLGGHTHRVIAPYCPISRLPLFPPMPQSGNRHTLRLGGNRHKDTVRHHPFIGGSGKAIHVYFRRIPLFGQGVFRFSATPRLFNGTKRTRCSALSSNTPYTLSSNAAKPSSASSAVWRKRYTSGFPSRTTSTRGVYSKPDDSCKPSKSMLPVMFSSTVTCFMLADMKGVVSCPVTYSRKAFADDRQDTPGELAEKPYFHPLHQYFRCRIVFPAEHFRPYDIFAFCINDCQVSD